MADSLIDRAAGQRSGCAMSLYSLLFWELVLGTALISLRWGAMIGLIVFVFVLMFGAVAISRLAAPKAAVTAAALLVPAESGRGSPTFNRTAISSIR